MFLLFLLVSQSLSQQQDFNYNQKQQYCDRLKEVSKQHKGYPYVWGGETKQEGGFDCSGFIYSVMKKMNKPLPRTTSKKYWLMIDSKKVSWNDAKCGYFIWWTFSIGRPYGHIGIHINQPYIWQSGSSTGPNKVKLFKKSYWVKYFVGSKEVK